ncbi:xanthine dehydrogenase family protein molybdopterin-binding subunit [Silicimonas algicola]|uniref:Isoquinoline 1-oxidoreductase beta subunit n=1 Tax=Silicimonas algicola TaxID=1826607 RepID=A0A316G954_9RHOB|nr:xanthine dehydrogenase family protein molybdopterin-binding subunit [Silicimonas algicola]AZQ68115.1 xanthine dehydrogenase family protein molybdopterin-binding subunit [Silicimonas algicola]PWK57424.1 isoquinoline 1-oxidoreductase beta subunit [Silicimonas algicola]
MNVTLSRRSFLATGSAGVLVGLTARGSWAAAHMGGTVVNPFVRIDPDGTVVVILKHFEMGQGTSTGLSTLVAEELDADWDKVAIEFAPANTEIYINTLFGVQGTGGSTAIANSYEQYRKAGAAARAMMVAAAARLWGVEASTVSVANGTVTSGSNTATFDDLIGGADAADIPAEPTLKDPSAFTLIGRDKLARKDSADKTTGKAIFAMDVMPEGVVYAVLLRSPKFGGKLASFDATTASAMPGVVAVKETPAGVAVFADNTWNAMQARDAVEAEWDFTEAETRSTDAMEADYAAALEEEGMIAQNDGGTDEALAAAAKTIEAEFRFPFLAHAPMEPLNCVVQIKDGKVKIWDGTQFHTVTQGAVGAVSGVGPENVSIETVYAGGSFGRRANFNSDYEVEATFAAMALGTGQPVKLVWTREDDIRGGYYRPMCWHRVRAGVDANGKATAWHSSLANKSIFSGTPMAAMAVHDGVDDFSVEGVKDTAYALPGLRVDLRNMESAIPVLWWRSVGHSHSAYAMEVAMDMLAEAAGADPVEFRRGLLAEKPRHLGVLNLAAEKAGWGGDLPEGWGRGIAVHQSFNSYVAEVAEVSSQDGRIKLERIVAAVDVGTAVNPDVIRAQVEGAIGYGLSHAMRQKITFTDGEVDQSNFPDYPPLRIGDMPKIEVHIVSSTEPPTGIGEPGLPPAGPAVANAIYQAIGRRVMRLPMEDDGIEFA